MSETPAIINESINISPKKTHKKNRTMIEHPEVATTTATQLTEMTERAKITGSIKLPSTRIKQLRNLRTSVPNLTLNRESLSQVFQLELSNAPV